MVGGEADGDENNIFAALGPMENVFAQFIGIRAEPFAPAKFRLVGQLAEGVREGFLHFLKGGLAFLFIDVTLFDKLFG